MGTMPLDISSHVKHSHFFSLFLMRLLGIVPLENRIPLTLDSFIGDILPALLCYYVTAVLVQLPRTFPIRFALLPFSLWSTFTAATRINVVGTFNDKRLVCWNQGYVLVLFAMAVRDVTWTFRIDPLKRLCSTHETDTASKDKPIKFWQIAINACDLFCNLRGLGWDWSIGLRVPVHTRPTYSRSAFLLATFRAASVVILMFDIFHYLVQWFSPSTIGSAQGGTIFDPSLSPVQRYIRSTLITSLGSVTIYYGICGLYDIATIIGVLVFRQTPDQWPPVFSRPWLSTSITEFWNIRWHQTFRDSFIRLGFIPFAFFFGRMGGVIGAFLMSGLTHFVGLWGMGNGGEFISITKVFVIMGVGTLLEYTFRKVTGRRVQGRWGRIWTYLWIAGWNNILFEAWCTKGLGGSVFLPAHIRPSYRLFGPLP